MFPHVQPADGIEPGARLIEQKELRAVQQTLGDFDAPLQPAGKRLHAIGPALGDSHRVEQFVDPRSHRSSREAVESRLVLQVFADRQPIVQRRGLKRHADLPRFDTVDALIAGGDFDGAVVCLPNDVGPDAVVSLARAGKHVLAEKPVAGSAPDARRIAEAVGESGVAFQNGYMWRYDEAAGRLRRMVGDGSFGKLISVEMEFVTSDITRRGPEHYLFDRAVSSGGFFNWLACHFLDLLLYVTGEKVVGVTARCGVFGAGQSDVEDGGVAILDLSGGGIATFLGGYWLPRWAGESRWTMRGTKRWVHWDPSRAGTGGALEIHGLTVSYDRKPVLRRVDLTVEKGRLVAIVGPNGAGKSTLLKAILGLVQVDAGSIRVFDQPAQSVRKEIAYVPQTDSADWDFPVTVREVVMMGRYGRLGLFGRPRRRDREIVAECVEIVGMSDFADRHIRQLSGGQQQRIFLARALAQEASILLLDEPFAGVDARTEAALFDLIEQFSAQGKTLIVVNHNLQVLERFDAILLLNEQVVAFGSYEQVVNETNLRRTYGGRMSFIDEAERQLREGPSDVR